MTFLDGFAGTGIVGKYFSDNYSLIVSANDCEYYSYIINYALLKVNYTDKLKTLIKELNKLIKPNKLALITNEYSPFGVEKRQFWTIENANKADAIIEYIKIDKEITKDEYLFILASLITSFDKVANTASVYGAFLKEFKKSAIKLFELSPIHRNKNIKHIGENIVYNLDINNDDILKYTYDIIYLDPPYNQRQYSSNYHPLNFIAKYNPEIKPYGKTGLLSDSFKSKFCSNKDVKTEFNDIINKMKANYIIVSYNNEGLLSKENLIEILSSKGKTVLYKFYYKKFKSSSKQLNERVVEYLYLCYVNKKGKYKEIEIDD